MSRSRPSFRRERTSGLGAARILGVLVLLGVVLLSFRASLPAPDAALEPIQVVGDVPSPGWYLLDEASLHSQFR